MTTTDLQIWRIQAITIVGAVGFLVFVLWLIRRRRISEEYGLLWLVGAAAVLAVSVWRGGLDVFAHLVGIAYPPAAIILVLLAAMVALLLHYSVVLTHHRAQLRTLVQEVAHLRHELAQQRETPTDSLRKP